MVVKIEFFCNKLAIITIFCVTMLQLKYICLIVIPNYFFCNFEVFSPGFWAVEGLSEFGFSGGSGSCLIGCGIGIATS